MKKIASFTIDHIKLQPGIYVSRKDYLGEEVITTFDIRMTSPNEEPVMNTAELHAMEHLAATFLRNHAECFPDFFLSLVAPGAAPIGNCTQMHIRKMNKSYHAKLLLINRSCLLFSGME